VLPPDTLLTDGVGTFTATFDTAGLQSLTVADTKTPNKIKGTASISVS
jgi:hypothetical protein